MRVLGIVESLRADSHNRRLLRAAADELRAPSSPSRHGDENPANSHPALSNACRSTEEVQTVYVRRAVALGGSGASGGRAAALDPSLNQYRARVQQSGRV